MLAVSRLCEFYPGICLASNEKARKNLSQVKKNLKTYMKKELCIKLVIYKDYTVMRGQQNIKLLSELGIS